MHAGDWTGRPIILTSTQQRVRCGKVCQYVDTGERIDMHRKLLVVAIATVLLLGTASLPSNAAAREVKYAGMCNASAAVALDSRKFIVADDEHNVLQIYDKTVPAKPFQSVPLSKVFAGEILDGDDEEIDLEGAATLGEKIFWIGSHSTSKKAKYRPARHRLFAITATPGKNGTFDIARAGKIYTTLIADLGKDDRFSQYKLAAAREIAPKDLGGLSIEGLAATPEGALLIAFRNPLRGGKVENGVLVGGMAFAVPLLNPLEVIDGKPAKFGDPLEMDLAGYGIRSIEARKNDYLVVAGPYHENAASAGHKREPSRLHLWSGNTDRQKPIGLKQLNIEAAFFYPGDDQYVQLLSDDGADCKNYFRSLTMRISPR